MAEKQRIHAAVRRLRVALEAIEGSKTINQLSSEYEIHPSLIRTWKQQLLGDVPSA